MDPKPAEMEGEGRTGFWAKLWGTSLVQSSRKSYESWKASGSALTKGATLVELGARCALTPVTSALTSITNSCPETASFISNIAVSCLEKTETAIQTTADTIANTDLLSCTGRFVVACLDDFIEAAENVLDVISPDVRLAPRNKSTDGSTQTTEQVPTEEQSEATKKPPRKSVTLNIKESSLLMQFRQFLVIPLTDVVRFLKYISAWLKSRTTCNKATTTCQSPEKPSKTPPQGDTKVNASLSRIRGVFSAMLTWLWDMISLKTLRDLLYRRQEHIKEFLFPTGKIKKKDSTKRKHSEVATDESNSDSDICDLNGDLEDYNSEDDKDWQPGKKDIHILKKDLDDSLEYNHDGDCAEDEGVHSSPTKIQQEINVAEGGLDPSGPTETTDTN